MAGFINVSGKSTSNKVTRRDVKMMEVFIVKGSDTPRVHVGTGEVPPSAETHWRSINLLTGEEASTRNGGSEVTIIGTAELNVDVHDDFRHLFD